MTNRARVRFGASVPSLAIDARSIDPIAEARFWALVEIDWRPGACWLWRGAEIANGYGRFKLNGSRISANRVSYALFNGSVPAGQFVCHTCDNPRCVRPDHLFLGSPADNAADRGAKGRHAHGERSGTARLTVGQVLEIDGALGSGQPHGAIADRYGVSKRTVQKIKSRANWAHLFPETRS